jgi:hypothetical protein
LYWKDGTWKPYQSCSSTGPGQNNNTISRRSAASDQPTIGIGQPNTGIGKTTIGIGQNSTGIGQPTIGIGQPTIGIGQPNTGIGKTTIGIGQNSTGIGQPTTGIGRPTIGIGQQPNTSRAASASRTPRTGSNTNWHRAAFNYRSSQSSRTNSVAKAYVQKKQSSN